jgi:hypothetical protein
MVVIVQNGSRKSSPGPWHSVNTEMYTVAKDTCKTEDGLLFRGPLCICEKKHEKHDIILSEWTTVRNV